MTQISLNSVKIETIFDLSITIQELVQYVCSNFLKDNETIIDIQIDNNKSKSEFNVKKIQEFNTINIETGLRILLVDKIINACSEHVFCTQEKIIQFTLGIRSGDCLLDVKMFVEIIDHLGLFIESMYTVSRMLNLSQGGEVREFLLFKEIEIHLLESLKKLLTAKKDNDYCSIADLLDYEIGPNLLRWSTDLIPKLKGMCV